MGVVRTNCMDNLDRTNVVQSTLAKWSLTKQLRELGILAEGEAIEQHDEFMHAFRDSTYSRNVIADSPLTLHLSVWANHADLISIAYSGTGAMKTDFTRTGRRTKLGSLKDGMNGSIRYVKNNYFDGPRQDAFDLFTGAWVPRGPSSAYALFFDPRPLFTRAVRLLLPV